MTVAAPIDHLHRVVATHEDRHTIGYVPSAMRETIRPTR